MGFHRTSKAAAVRDQIVVDMREGRKWNVQVSLISQSIDDFDKTMVEFATSIFIMDAGPEQAVQRTASVFGLGQTAQSALRNHVSGPSESGANILCQFSTKSGNNTQLLTLTLGPIELWAFSTTVEDTTLRNLLYDRIGSKEARRVLAKLFPSGTAKKTIERLLNESKETTGFIDEQQQKDILRKMVSTIVSKYQENPHLSHIAF